MPIAEIQRVCFVGAGTMGCYNAVVAAISGYDVSVYDVDADTLDKAPERQAEFAAFLVTHGYCAEDAVPAALRRIALVPELDAAVAHTDLVSESVFERLDIKRDVHRRLDQACPATTLLTTNSSALRVSDIEDVVARGERFAALHSHLGAPLVDIVGGPRTDPATIDILRRYVLSLGGVPLVLKKEHPGYVLNAMLGGLLTMGMLLVSRGDATVEAVDAAWMARRQAPMGPFGMMDLFGLNLIHDSWQYREADGDGEAARSSVLSLLRPFVDRGELGMKSGRGFYDYPDPAYRHERFPADASARPGENPATLQAALDVAWIGNAAVLAALEVAAPDDIDLAWRVGTHLDEGPLALLSGMDPAAFLAHVEQQVDAGRFEHRKAALVAAYLEPDRPMRTAP